MSSKNTAKMNYTIAVPNFNLLFPSDSRYSSSVCSSHGMKPGFDPRWVYAIITVVKNVWTQWRLWWVVSHRFSSSLVGILQVFFHSLHRCEAVFSKIPSRSPSFGLMCSSKMYYSKPVWLMCGIFSFLIKYAKCIFLISLRWNNYYLKFYYIKDCKQLIAAKETFGRIYNTYELFYLLINCYG